MLKPETEEYLARIERSTGRTFRFREEIAKLVELGASDRPQFDELLFLAKFVKQASAILARGRSDETARLTDEFAAVMEKVTGILGRITSAGPAEVRDDFAKRFLVRGMDEFALLTALLAELSRLHDDAIDADAGGKG